MWKEPKVPRSAVQVIVVDRNGMFFAMHRSKNVRSAKDVWSFPSGLHEIGQTVLDTAARELEEEYDLKMIAGCEAGTYENIAGDEGDQEQYHWVITLMIGLVDDVKLFVNKEPDKHDDAIFAPIENFNLEFLSRYRFHPSFDKYARANVVELRRFMTRVSKTRI